MRKVTHIGASSYDFIPDIEPIPPRGYLATYGRHAPEVIAESRIIPDDYPKSHYPENHPTRKYLANAEHAADTDMPFTSPVYQGLDKRLEGQNLHFPPPAFEVPGEGNLLAQLALLHGTEGDAEYYHNKYNTGNLVEAASEVADELFFERAAMASELGGASLFGEVDDASGAIAEVYHLPTHRAA